jgi:hypothetical protein
MRRNLGQRLSEKKDSKKSNAGRDVSQEGTSRPPRASLGGPLQGSDVEASGSSEGTSFGYRFGFSFQSPQQNNVGGAVPQNVTDKSMFEPSGSQQTTPSNSVSDGLSSRMQYLLNQLSAQNQSSQLQQHQTLQRPVSIQPELPLYPASVSTQQQFMYPAYANSQQESGNIAQMRGMPASYMTLPGGMVGKNTKVELDH